MRPRYTFRARETSQVTPTYYFLEAKPGTLSLFPDNSKAVAAGRITCLVFGTIGLLALYFLSSLLLPITYVVGLTVSALFMVIYKSQSWITMNAARFVRQTSHFMDAKVKEKALSNLNHELTVEAEGQGYILQVRCLRRTILDALALSTLTPPWDLRQSTQRSGWTKLSQSIIKASATAKVKARESQPRST